MKPNTYAVYTISVSPARRTLYDMLRQAIPAGAIQETKERYFVPRLVTFWRGDEEERDWQETLRRKLKEVSEHATVVIEANEWTPAEGYPQGDLTL